jgi:hypothetical protein
MGSPRSGNKKWMDGGRGGARFARESRAALFFTTITIVCSLHAAQLRHTNCTDDGRQQYDSLAFDWAYLLPHDRQEQAD